MDDRVKIVYSFEENEKSIEVLIYYPHYIFPWRSEDLITSYMKFKFNAPNKEDTSKDDVFFKHGLIFDEGIEPCYIYQISCKGYSVKDFEKYVTVFIQELYQMCIIAYGCVVLIEEGGLTDDGVGPSVEDVEWADD